MATQTIHVPTPASVTPGTTYAASETATVSAQNTFTDPVLVQDEYQVAIEPDGNVTATYTVQRREVGGSAWTDLKSWAYSAESGDTVESGYIAAGPWEMRIGCKTGGYTSGDADVSIFVG